MRSGSVARVMSAWPSAHRADTPRQLSAVCLEETFTLRTGIDAIYGAQRRGRLAWIPTVK